ncbi:DMT family transporter [Nocardia sp. CDC159]|uniref:DMT family transporter n=1 Tax=Nocardia pulmonis TaxID=2951408 RepID=A0A9X2IXV6_9NOCA|nr:MULTISPECIES: DMT family transporter [Nocardia]MCM6775793.1 DMT family transporter [Nocardia pulmonis]MCM6788231.1 DMT family transporter [Nocardia sp. CDC159]
MRITLSLIVVMVLWGSAFACSKLAVGAVPHEVAGFLRFGIGTLALLVLGIPRLAPADAVRAGGLGLIGVFGYNALFFLGLSLAPAADGSVIVPMTAPLLTVAVTALLGRIRLARTHVLGLITAIVGGVLFFLGIPAAGSSRLLGDLAFVGAAVCWAGYTILGAPMLSRLPAFTVTVCATAAGTVALGILAAPALTTVPWSDLSAGFWLNTLYLGVLPTALAYSLYYRAVHAAGPATASSAMFLVPVFGLACAWLLLGETIGPLQAVGATLLLLGAWFATAATRTRPAMITEQPSAQRS